MANLLATCATNYGSSTMCWSSTDMKAANFWVCSGSDSFKLDQGGSVFDIWVSDSSISHQPRNILRAYNQGNCIILGQGCSSNTNATIPVYACHCLQSPTITATTRMYTPEIRNPAADAYLDLLSGCHDSGYGGIHIKNCNGSGKGYLYWGGTNSFGLLHCAGGWAVKLNGDTSVYLFYNNSLKLQTTSGGVTVTGGATATTFVCGTTCLKSAIVCATNYLRADTQAGLCLSHSNPVICTGGSYTYFPSGIYVSGGTLYVANDLMARTGVCADTNSPLNLYGGNNAERCTVLHGKTFSCCCVKSPIVCATSCIRTESKLKFNYPSNCGPYLETGGTYTAPNLHLKHFNGSTDCTGFSAGRVCGTVCLCSPYICGTSCVKTGRVCICNGNNYLNMVSTCDANYNFSICAMWSWACPLNITSYGSSIIKQCSGHAVTSLWAAGSEIICLCSGGACVAGMVCSPIVCYTNTLCGGRHVDSCNKYYNTSNSVGTNVTTTLDGWYHLLTFSEGQSPFYVSLKSSAHSSSTFAITMAYYGSDVVNINVLGAQYVANSCYPNARCVKVVKDATNSKYVLLVNLYKSSNTTFCGFGLCTSVWSRTGAAPPSLCACLCTTCTACTCLGGVNLTLTGFQTNCCVTASIICGTSCVDAAVVKIPGTQTIELASTTHSLKVKNLGSAGSSGLVLQGSGGAHHLQLYGTGSQYGFLDGAWAGWDIRKTVNGNLDVWVGSSGFICACEGGVSAATCVKSPIVCGTTCVNTPTVCGTSCVRGNLIYGNQNICSAGVLYGAGLWCMPVGGGGNRLLIGTKRALEGTTDGATLGLGEDYTCVWSRAGCFEAAGCVISPIVCGTTCLRGAVICATSCILLCTKGIMGGDAGGGNLNSAENKASAIYYCRYNCAATNKPVTVNNANGILTMLTHSGPYGKQIAFGDNNDLYIRKITNNSFGTWYKVITTYNCGSGDISGVTAGAGLAGGGSSGTVTLCHSDTSSASNIDTSGAAVVNQLNVDTYGHVTTLNTRNLTLANLGYTGATNANYITNNSQLSNGCGYTTVSVGTGSGNAHRGDHGVTAYNHSQSKHLCCTTYWNIDNWLSYNGGGGLYWPACASYHWYPTSNACMTLRNNQTSLAIRFFTSHGADTTMGHLYGDCSHNFGLLDCGGAWRVRVHGTSSISLCNPTCVYGTLTGNGEIRSSTNCTTGSGWATRTAGCIYAGGYIRGQQWVCSDGYLRAGTYVSGYTCVVAGTCMCADSSVCGAQCVKSPIVCATSCVQSVCSKINSTGSEYHALANCSTNELYIQPHTYTRILKGYGYTSSNRKMCASDTSLLIASGGIVCACTALHSPIVCATSSIKSPNISCFWSPLSGNDDWQSSPITIRERGLNSSACNHCKYAPNINFHWGGIYSNSLWMSNDGWLHWGNYDSAGIPATSSGFCTDRLCAVTAVCSPTVCATTCIQSPIVCGTSCVRGEAVYANNCVCANIIKNKAGNAYLNVYSGCTNPGGTLYRDCSGNNRGYVYFDSTANFGLLSCSGSWAVRIIGNTSMMLCKPTCVAGALTGSLTICATTCLCSPIICGTSCVRGGVLQSTGMVTGTCTCGTVCLRTPYLRVDGSSLHCGHTVISSTANSCMPLTLQSAETNTACIGIEFKDNYGSGAYGQTGCLFSCHGDTNLGQTVGFHFGFITSETSLGVVVRNTNAASGFYTGSGNSYINNACVKSPTLCGTTCIRSACLHSTATITGDSGVYSPIICGTTCVRGGVLCATTCAKVNKLCLLNDVSGDMANGIVLGSNAGIPQAAWGESSTTTGRIEIGLPTKDGQGGSVHYGMVQVQVDVYEYNGNNTMSFLVGGHNWGRNWHNKGIHMIGGCTDKTLKLAYHECGGTCNGRYVILIGEPGSSWNYGSVHVRRINNGLYYAGAMDFGTPMYVKRVTCADSYYMNTTGDLRPSSKSMAGYQCALTCSSTAIGCASSCFTAPHVCGTTCIRSACLHSTATITGDSGVYSPIVCGTTCVRGACVHATGNIRGEEICSGSWFRNESSGEGLYNSATGQHFYSDGDDYWNVAGGTSANAIRFRDENAGTVRGVIYANSSNEIGFLDQGQDWTYKAKNDDGHYWYTNNTATRMCLNTSGQLFVCGCVQTQVLCGTSAVRAPEICATNWFRNADAGEGLYNESSCSHFYSAGDNYWHINNRCTASSGGLVFYKAHNASQGHLTNRRGYIYWDGTANFGLLSCAGNWGIRLEADTNICLGKRTFVCTCVCSPIVCATCQFKGNCLHIDGGTQNTLSDATVYITATNNADWGLVVNKNNSSASEYGIDSRVGSTSVLAYSALFAGTRKFLVGYNCLCHNTMICSPAIKASSYMNSGKFCSGSTYMCNICAHVAGNVTATAFYGSGANLTNLPSSGWNASGGCTCTSWTSLRTSVGYCTLECESAANSNNVVFGGNSFRKSSTGVENAVLGSNVGSYSTVFPLVSYNTFVGNRIASYLGANTCCNAQYNVSMGYQSMANLSTGCYNTAVGTWALISNTNRLTSKMNTAVGMYALKSISTSTGCNTAIGACAGYATAGSRNTYIGYKAGYNHTGSDTTIIGACGQSCTCICGNTYIAGSLSKSSGCFLISHPDPAKKDRMNLSHSFVESPTEGDNIYRWQVSTENCRSVVELPTYYKFLNKNDMVWVSPHRSFGAAYGKVTEDQECLIVCSNEDGCYNVLLIGTRKDEAVRNWNGVESLVINN